METAYTADFGDGAYRFWLPMPRVVAVEREIGGSIFALFSNIGENLASAGGELVLAGPSDATIKQCHSVIRNALIGGNEGRVGAEVVAVGDTLGLELVQTYCFPARPAMHDMALAWRILKAAIYGVELPDSAKKKSAVAEAGASSRAK